MRDETHASQAVQKIGKYTVERILGQGSMGLVYLARDPTIGRPVALKTIHLPPGLDEARTAEFRERFLREARAAGRLNHSSIVTIYEADDGSAGSVPFIAMEFVDGVPWNRRIRKGVPGEPEAVLPLIRELASALDYAHKSGVVHRDIKPANIIETKDGHAKLMDFGIARVPTSELTQEGQCPGTPAYMSPEQVLGEKVDGRSDLFSLGAVLYELLTCQKPFPGENISTITYRILNSPAPLVQEINPTAGHEVDQMVRHLLAKKAEDRYATGRELMEDIDAYMAGASLPHAGTAHPHERAPGPAPLPSSPPQPVPRTAPPEPTTSGVAPVAPPAAAPPAAPPGPVQPSAPGARTAPQAPPPVRVTARAPRSGKKGLLIAGLLAGAVLAIAALSLGGFLWLKGRQAPPEGPVPYSTTELPYAAPANEPTGAANAIQPPPQTPPAAEKPKPKRAKPKPVEPAAPVETPAVEPAPPPPPPPPQDATVSYTFRTGVVKGEFSFSVDGKEVAKQVIRRKFSMKGELYAGSFTLPPGTHTLRFVVKTELQNLSESHEESVSFEPGQGRTLRVVMTKFNKEIRFEWGS